jgi:LysR family cys regulon transcriptional activator
MTTKLRQLKCLCEVALCGYSLSEAARRLSASQSTITRQLQLLEQEVGFAVLLRRKNRIEGLTRQGHSVYERAQRIPYEVAQVERLREESQTSGVPGLVIATTHFHARYTLLGAIKRLRATYPRISFSILSGDTAAIQDLVMSGRADMGICVGGSRPHSELASIPCFEIRRVIITPPKHYLLKVRRPSLEVLAKYPLITYDQGVSAGWRITEAFAARGLAPEIVLSAVGAEVIKAYVAAELGVAVIQELAFDRRRDRAIRAIPADHLFEPVRAIVTMRKGAFLSHHMRELLRIVAPDADDPMLARLLAHP